MRVIQSAAPRGLGDWATLNNACNNPRRRRAGARAFTAMIRVVTDRPCGSSARQAFNGASAGFRALRQGVPALGAAMHHKGFASTRRPECPICRRAPRQRRLASPPSPPTSPLQTIGSVGRRCRFQMKPRLFMLRRHMCETHGTLRVVPLGTKMHAARKGKSGAGTRWSYEAKQNSIRWERKMYTSCLLHSRDTVAHIYGTLR